MFIKKNTPLMVTKTVLKNPKTTLKQSSKMIFKSIKHNNLGKH